MAATLTPDEIVSIATALHGSPAGAVSALADRLGVSKRTATRWARGQAAVPPGVAEELRALVGLGAPADTAWRRDEWIIGEGGEGTDGTCRQYLIHAWPPRFRARVVLVDEAGEPSEEELPADVLSGIVYAGGVDFVLCEIEWIDPAPFGEELLALMDQAADRVSDAE